MINNYGITQDGVCGPPYLNDLEIYLNEQLSTQMIP